MTTIQVGSTQKPIVVSQGKMGPAGPVGPIGPAGPVSGAPKGVYATLTALQTAFPTGNPNIYLVTADGHWYYWNDFTWVSGGAYLTTQWVGALTTQDEPWEVV
jgi:hypothetical protein